MGLHLTTGENRSHAIHFTMTLRLWSAIRETTGPHEVAAYIRRAVACYRAISATPERRGNICSFVFKVTPGMAERIEARSKEQGLSASAFIEACCWEWVAHNKPCLSGSFPTGSKFGT